MGDLRIGDRTCKSTDSACILKAARVEQHKGKKAECVELLFTPATIQAGVECIAEYRALVEGDKKAKPKEVESKKDKRAECAKLLSDPATIQAGAECAKLLVTPATMQVGAERMVEYKALIEGDKRANPKEVSVITVLSQNIQIFITK